MASRLIRTKRIAMGLLIDKVMDEGRDALKDLEPEYRDDNGGETW